MAGRRILLILALAVCGTAAGDQWNIVVVDSAGSQGKFSSIKLDGSDTPHIAYLGDHLAGILKYTVRVDGEWNIWTVFEHNIIGYITLALIPPQYPDTAWLPRISSCYSHPGYDAVFYSSFDGNQWSSEWVGAVSSGLYSSMALDSENNPHISFMDSFDLILRYAYFNGSDWQITTVDHIYFSGYYTSIAIEPGSTDRVHISYRNEQDDCLRYAYFNGSNWDITTVDDDGDVGRFTSLALDSGNNPHISYEDNTNGDLKYAMWSGSSWEITSPDTLSGSISGTSLVIDSQDHPHIAYESDYGNLKYAHWSGTAWEMTTVDPTIGSGAGSHSTSIDVDSGDDPHITYWDGDRLDLKYAYYGPVGIEDHEPSVDFMLSSIHPNPAVTNVNLEFTVPQFASVAFRVYDLSGRTVIEVEEYFEPGAHSVILDGLDTGVYFVSMRSGAFSDTSRFLVLR